jgi:hypothetical protein
MGRWSRRHNQISDHSDAQAIPNLVPIPDIHTHVRWYDPLMWSLSLGVHRMTQTTEQQRDSWFSRTVSLAQGVYAILVLVSIVAGAAFTLGLRMAQLEWRNSVIESNISSLQRQSADLLAVQNLVRERLARLEEKIDANGNRIDKLADGLNAAIAKQK